MKDIKLIIDGKEVKLTDEQVKILGIERKNPFDRVDGDDRHYYTIVGSDVLRRVDINDRTDRGLYNAINYFSDKAFAEQVALHQLLYRKLLKFAYDNEAEDTAEWNGYSYHFYIRYEYNDGVDESALAVAATVMNKSANEVYFSSNDAAFRAIKEVVEPFIKEHPNFVW